MTLITKIPGVVFTDKTLPKLYRDSIITAGTKFCLDSADLYSYPKQSTPTAGLDTWGDLSPNANQASFAGQAAVFSGGGFTYNPQVSGSYLSLPASGKSLADATGFMFGCWIKHLAPSANSYASIMGMCDNTNPATHQYSLDMGAANSGNYRMNVMGSMGFAIAPALNSVHQFVFGAKKLSNGTYDKYFWHNGVLMATVNVADTAIGQPALTNPRIAVVPGFTLGGGFAVFRAFFDDTSVLADVSAMTARVLKDYNDNVSRFS